MRREVLCAAGEWLRCDDGHDAFRAVRDIYLGEVIWSADLIDRHGDRPRVARKINWPLTKDQMARSSTA